MPVAIGVGLEEDGSGCVLRSVGGNGEGGRQVGKVKNRFREEKAFEGFEGRLARGGPIPDKVLFGEINEGTGDIGVVRNKAPVEVGEAKE